MYEKGMLAEIKASREIHKMGVALLISHQVLRSRQCGQVDLAVISKREIECYEVKDRKIGKKQLHPRQKRRLGNAMNLLGAVFDREVVLKIWEP